VDGQVDEVWQKAALLEAPRLGFAGKVKIRSFISNGEIFFLLEWSDATENKLHKPWRWNGRKELYSSGPERQDELVIRWLTGMDAEGQRSSSDLWFWGAAQTRAGYADDRHEILSQAPLAKGVLCRDFEGRSYYQQNSGDAGSKCWQELLLTEKFWKEPQRYRPEVPSGSRADVRAAARWQEGTWRLELSRKLFTGNSDDLQFRWSEQYLFDIASGLWQNAHLVATLGIFRDRRQPQRYPLLLVMPGKPLPLKAAEEGTNESD
jgi:hypothetical protein